MSEVLAEAQDLLLAYLTLVSELDPPLPGSRNTWLPRRRNKPRRLEIEETQGAGQSNAW